MPGKGSKDACYSLLPVPAIRRGCEGFRRINYEFTFEKAAPKKQIIKKSCSINERDLGLPVNAAEADAEHHHVAVLLFAKMPLDRGLPDQGQFESGARLLFA